MNSTTGPLAGKHGETGRYVDQAQIAIARRLIRADSTVIDLSNGHHGWSDSLLIQTPSLQRLLAYVPSDVVGAASAHFADRSCVAVRSSPDTGCPLLDEEARSEGLEHIHFVRIGDKGRLSRILDGASRLIAHSRIDHILFPTPTPHDAVDRQTVRRLAQSRYVLYAFSESGWLRHLEWPAGSDSRSEWTLAIHERLVALVHRTGAQDLDLPFLFRAYGLSPQGVIHVGAYDGAELPLYQRMGFQNIVLVEPAPGPFERLLRRVDGAPDTTTIQAAVVEKDGPVVLHVTSFDQSSSVLRLAKHKMRYPAITEVNNITVPGITLDSLFRSRHWDGSAINTLVIDIQGAELLALRGAAKTLPYLDAIATELNFEELYEGCAQVDEIDNFLRPFDLVRVKTASPWHPSWANGFYVRREFLQNCPPRC